MLIDIMTYLKAQIKWKRNHVLTTCNAIKMPVRIAACKLPQNRANMALTFFSPFITTRNYSAPHIIAVVLVRICNPHA